MSALTWDESAKRLYETGVDHVALFVMNGSNYTTGVAWNGVTGITENPECADANDIYADNIKYLSLISVENWKATIKAYTWPLEFNACQGELEYNDGTVRGLYFGQQDHVKFGLAWRTIQGNATEGDAYGYKIHIAYGLTAAPSEKDHATVNDSPEATEFSWELNSIPESFNNKVDGKDLDPVAHFVIDSRDNEAYYNKIEAYVFGSQSNVPTLPKPDALVTLLNSAV